MKKQSPPSRKVNLVHELFAQHMKELGIVVDREEEFIVGRKFRWDFSFALVTEESDSQLWGIEIDGYFNGRHKAFGGDNEKMNLATVNNWKFLRFSTNDVKRGVAKSFIAEHLLGIKENLL